MPGILDITAHGRIGPRLIHVPVETQVQVHQFRDVLHQMMIESQSLQTLAGHFGTHRIMMMEAHLASRLETSGLRLADIMHHCSQTQREVRSGHRAIRAGFQSDGPFKHDHRVLKDIFVPMMLVNLQLQRRNLGEHDIRQT